MENTKGQLVVALDVDTFEEAKILIDELKDVIHIFKVGSQLFTACGQEVIPYLYSLGKKVFLDLKFHDIPNTVANAVGTAIKIGDGHLFMLTVHTQGGRDMLEAAVAASQKSAQTLGVHRPLIIGITVLTSEENGDNIQQIVKERALLAKATGCDGVVASSHEVKLIRQECGEDFVVVTPGVRPKGTEAGDQKRIATPTEAILSGSDFLVVGRPIVKAPSPCDSAQKIIDEIQKAK